MSRIADIWKQTSQYRSEIGLIYLVQLAFGLVVGIVMCLTINTHLGNSVALEQLAKGFDRTVIMDAIYNHDNTLGSAKSIAIFLIPIYLLFSILLQGGLLSNIKTRSRGIKSQIKSGAKNFLAFFGIAIISILLVVAFIVVVGIPFSKFVGDPLQTFYSEKPFVLSLIALSILFSFWLAFVWSWSVSARYSYLEKPEFWKAIRSGLKNTKQNFFKLFSIAYLFFGMNVLLAYIYYLIMGDRGAPSYTIVLFGIIVQQIFSYLRVYLRGLAYNSVDQL